MRTSAQVSSVILDIAYQAFIKELKPTSGHTVLVDSFTPRKIESDHFVFFFLASLIGPIIMFHSLLPLASVT